MLIKHVLSSLPTHLLFAAVIPVATFKSIERICVVGFGGGPRPSRLGIIGFGGLNFVTR